MGLLYGVAKKATVVGLKVLDEKGRGSMGGIAAGIDHIVSQRQAAAEDDQPPAIINLSVGGSKSFALNDAIDRAGK